MNCSGTFDFTMCPGRPHNRMNLVGCVNQGLTRGGRGVLMSGILCLFRTTGAWPSSGSGWLMTDDRVDRYLPATAPVTTVDAATIRSNVMVQLSQLEDPVGSQLTTWRGVVVFQRWIRAPHGEGPILGTEVVVDTAGNLAVTRRATLTRMAAGGLLLGPLGALLSTGVSKPKRHDVREVYLLIENPQFSSVVPCLPREGPKARQFAAQINTLAKQASNAEPARQKLIGDLRASLERLSLPRPTYEDILQRFETDLATGPSSPHWDSARYNALSQEVHRYSEQIKAQAALALDLAAKIRTATAARNFALAKALGSQVRAVAVAAARDLKRNQDVQAEMRPLIDEQAVDRLRALRDPVSAALLAELRACEESANGGDEAAQERLNGLKGRWTALQDELRARAYHEHHRGPSGETVDLAGQLTQIDQLHASGVLTDAEFTAAKARLLGL
jgi:Short C-terminal domain